MPRAGDVIYSYCGLICSYCKALLSGFCEGCDAHVDECLYAKCARSRGVKTCLSCRDFPCRLHLEGFKWETEEYGTLQWKVFSEVFMELLSKAAPSSGNNQEDRRSD